MNERFNITRFLATTLRDVVETIGRLPPCLRQNVGIFVLKTDENGTEGIMHGPECGYDFLSKALQNASTNEIEIRVESWLPGTDGVPNSVAIRADL